MGLIEKISRFLSKSAVWAGTAIIAAVGVNIGGQWFSISGIGLIDPALLVTIMIGIAKNLHDLWVEIPEEKGTKAVEYPTSAYLKTW
jgi:hypothetical protein